MMRRGFTLVEWLITLVIMGLLLALFWPEISYYPNYRQRARQALAKQALENLARAQESYFAKNGRYSASRSNLGTWTKDPSVLVTILAADATSWSATAKQFDSDRIFTYASARGGLLSR